MSNYFFDIGANIGQTFDEYLAKHPEYDGWNVWCFEPSPRHLAQLLQKAEEYKDRYQITVFPFGVGRHGLFSFGEREDPLADQFQYHGFAQYFSKKGYSISNYSVQIFFLLDQIPFTPEQFMFPQVVLKLDCEGAEYDILNSIAMDIKHIGRYHKFITRILVEWHPHPLRTHEARLELEKIITSKIPIEPWTL